MKIGVIGLGSIGGRHFKNLLDMDHECYGYDSDPTSKNIPCVPWKPDYAKKLDAVVICSPTENHREHFIAAGEAGKPIFIEKPIFATQNDYDVLAPGIWASAKSSRDMVGYNLRFHPCVQQANEWIENDIGYIEWANFVLGQHSIKPPYLRDGVILNWSHEIDLALFLLGDGRVVHSATRLVDGGRDDLTDILIKHSHMCRSSIHLDYVTQPEVRQSIIVGTKATVIIDLVTHNAWLRDLDGQIIDNVKSDGWDETYIDEMQAFLDRIDGKETIGATAEEGLKVLKVCLEVRKQAGL